MYSFAKHNMANDKKHNMKEEISASFRSLRSTSPLLIVSETKIQNTTNIINKKSWTIYSEDEYKD